MQYKEVCKTVKLSQPQRLDQDGNTRSRTYGIVQRHVSVGMAK